jgi:hypothetical protein
VISEAAEQSTQRLESGRTRVAVREWPQESGRTRVAVREWPHFSFLYLADSGSVTHPASYSMITAEDFSEVKDADP